MGENVVDFEKLIVAVEKQLQDAKNAIPNVAKEIAHRHAARRLRSIASVLNESNISSIRIESMVTLLEQAAKREDALAETPLNMES